MRVEPAVAAKHYEAAAIEQMAQRLRQEGYRVEEQARFGDLEADLVARNDRETIVYEFKVPGGAGTPPEWARRAAELRTRVVEAGARFRLVIVRPPRETRVEVQGIEEALIEVCQNDPGLAGLAAEVVVREVSNLQLSSVRVEPERTRVAGEGTALAELHDADDEATAEDHFPFAFDVTLDRQGRLAAVHELRMDLSSWLGPDNATLPLAGE